MHVYDVFKELRKDRARHTPPRGSKKKQKKRSVSKMKVQVVTINSVQESSKSELSSRGKRPFKVFRFYVFVFFLPETLNGRLPPEDSSDFDDSWTELIVMT